MHSEEKKIRLQEKKKYIYFRMKKKGKIKLKKFIFKFR